LFLTIQKEGHSIYKDKGSKFLAQATSCISENQAKEIIADLRKQNPGCVHVCYAYRLGSDKRKYKYSDDGEPSNSAGAPIFGQIKSFDLTNVLITVVRYYGGTNLGVGGLIQAYKTASKQAVEDAETVLEEDRKNIKINFSYDNLHLVMNEIKSSNCQVIEKKLEADCQIKLSIPVSNSELIEKLSRIKNVTINQ
tara:strand:- start:1725 stop:2309 length:585 start_codon:yes stop_codon:yes gene_type:complete